MQNEKDVVIIGGGAVGVCAAYYLWKSGREVTVIDKGAIGGGASHGNAGLVVPSHVVPLAAPGVIAQGLRWLFKRESPFYIRPRLDRRLFAWLWRFWRSCTRRHVSTSVPVLCALSLASRALFEELSADDDIPDFGFEQTGLLMLHEGEKGRKKDLEEAEWAERAGLNVSVLDAASLHNLEPALPPQVQGGVYHHQDGLIDPASFIRSLRDFLKERGVSFRPAERVTGFRRSGRKLTSIVTAQGEMQPREVVLAAGAWSGRLARELHVRLPIQPAKGYSLTYGEPRRQPHIPFILTEAKVSVTPLAGRLRFAGTLELAGFDRAVDLHRLQPIRDVAAHYVTDTRQEAWVGYRPCSPDGLPILGRPAAYSNLVVATGHAMIGMSLAPVTGKLVSEIVGGKPSSVPIAPLSVERFQ